jgi:hypothetical protein
MNIAVQAGTEELLRLRPGVFLASGFMLGSRGR